MEATCGMLVYLLGKGYKVIYLLLVVMLSRAVLVELQGLKVDSAGWEEQESSLGEPSELW